MTGAITYDPATKRAKLTVYAGLDLLGRQRQRTKTWRSPNERTARREAAAHEAKIREDIGARAARSKTLEGLMDEWCKLRDAKDSPSTVRKRAGMVRRIRDDLGRIRLDELTARHVDQWMGRMRAHLDDAGVRTYSDTTIANHWSCLRAILRQGDRWDLVTARATSQARPPRRLGNRRPTPPTAAAVQVLIAAAKPDLRMSAMLAAYAGLRRGEVLALRWPDIDGDVIHVRRAVVEMKGADAPHHVKAPKSEEPRDVNIDTDLVLALAERRQELERRASELGSILAEDAAVIPWMVKDPTGRRERRLGWLTQAWARHADRMGAPDVRFHDLRHHYATELIDGGVAMPIVQRQLGHLQLSTTQNVYAHAVEEGGRRAAEVLRQRRALPGGSVNGEIPVAR